MKINLFLFIVLILLTSCANQKPIIISPQKKTHIKPKFTPMSVRLDKCISKYVKELDMSGEEALNICNSIYRRK